MQSFIQTIKIARAADGWTWLLMNGEGLSAGSGKASGQDAAMDIAWRVARSFAPSLTRPYPEIIVDAAARQPAPASHFLSDAG
jgi:hypothetical protein